MEHDGAMAQALAEITRQIAGAVVLIVTTLVTGSVGVLIVAANSYFARKKAILLETKIVDVQSKMQINTAATLETKDRVADVKSDVKEAKETADKAKIDANNAKAQAIIVDQAARRMSNEVLQQVSETKELVLTGNVAMNGRTTELVDKAEAKGRAEGLIEGVKLNDGIVSRIERLEGGQEVLVQGHTLLIKSIDRLMEEVHEISKDVKAQSKHD